MLGATCCCSPMLAATTLEGTQPAHCRVTWTDDPATAATVSWSTREAGTTHMLRFRVKGADGEADATLAEGNAMAESGRYTGGQAEFYYHHVRLTDLTPSTQYEVQGH